MRLRWVHLLLGGALLMPYFLLSAVTLQTAGAGRHTGLLGGSPVWQLAAYGLALPLVAATALAFPLVRALETAAAEALCGLRPGTLAPGPARSAAARRRSAAWFTLHTGLGALVSGATLAVPPMAVVLLAVPFVPALRESSAMGRYEVLLAPTPLLSPVYGLVMLVLLAAAARGAGALLARCAPALLGPTPSERLAEAERRAARLAARNHMARELHDSIGHALSAVALQAAAARRVLESDPGFVREALAAVEETAGDAVAELDSVLAVLREDDPAERPAGRRGPAGARLVGEVEELLRRSRAAGLQVELAADERLRRDELPPHVASAAYRIVQEGLNNALRHAAAQPLNARLTLTHEELTIIMVNPLPGPATGPATGPAGPGTRPRTGGGRGLRGVAERASLLGGCATAGPEGDAWRLAARLPVAGKGSGR